MFAANAGDTWGTSLKVSAIVLLVWNGSMCVSCVSIATETMELDAKLQEGVIAMKTIVDNKNEKPFVFV